MRGHEGDDDDDDDVMLLIMTRCIRLNSRLSSVLLKRLIWMCLIGIGFYRRDVVGVYTKCCCFYFLNKDYEQHQRGKRSERQAKGEMS